MTLNLGVFELERGNSHSLIFPARTTGGVPLTNMASNLLHNQVQPTAFRCMCVFSELGYHYSAGLAPDTYSTGGSLQELNLGHIVNKAQVMEVGYYLGLVAAVSGSPVETIYLGNEVPDDIQTDSMNGWYVECYDAALENILSTGDQVDDSAIVGSNYQLDMATGVLCDAGDYVKCYNGYHQIILASTAEGLASGDGRILPFSMTKDQMIWVTIDSRDSTFAMEPVEFMIKVRKPSDTKIIVGWTPDYSTGYMKARVTGYANGMLQTSTPVGASTGPDPSQVGTHEYNRHLPTAVNMQVWDENCEVVCSDVEVADAETRDGIFLVNKEPRLTGTSTARSATTLVDSSSDTDLPATDDLLIGDYVMLTGGERTMDVSISSVSTDHIVVAGDAGFQVSLAEVLVDIDNWVLYIPSTGLWQAITTIVAAESKVYTAVTALTSGITVMLVPRVAITDYAQSSNTITHGTVASISTGNSGQGTYEVHRKIQAGATYRVRTKMTWGDDELEDEQEFSSLNSMRLAFAVNAISHAESTGQYTVIMVGPVLGSNGVNRDLKSIVATLYNGSGEVTNTWSVTNATTSPATSTTSWFDETGGVFHLVRTGLPFTENDILRLDVSVVVGQSRISESFAIPAQSPA